MSKLVIELDIPTTEKILQIGENSETAVRVKEYVIAEILRRYSKEVFGNDKVQAAIAEMQKNAEVSIKKYCETELANYVKVTAAGKDKFSYQLNERVKQGIRDEIIRNYHSQINNLVREVFEEKKAEFEGTLLQTAETYFEESFKPKAEARLKKLAGDLTTRLIGETMPPDQPEGN